MSHFLDRLLFFREYLDTFSGSHGVVKREERTWENASRDRWNHDRVVRSTHGVNCTGSCGWRIYVKNGLITWETQEMDYTRTRADLPDQSPADVLVVPAIPGTSTARNASSTRWCGLA